MGGAIADSRGETIWLVGMMGAGKTAVGRALAARLGRRFVDTDREIERAAGMSIAALFDREGEPAFRAREAQAIEKVAGSPVVAALGGGAIAQSGAARRLAATGTVVYLRARPETLVDRLADAGDRPLLDGLDRPERLARLRELLEKREAAYATARLAVDTDEREIDELAGRLATELVPPDEGDR